MTNQVFVRDYTRNQVLESRVGKTPFPVSLVAVNFMFEGNIGFLIRSAACLGAKDVVVIGDYNPLDSEIKKTSANTSRYMPYRQFKNPHEFLSNIEDNANVISIELSDSSTSLFEFRFDFQAPTYIVVGHETIGVPAEILHNSIHVEIPMFGFGNCLNTSQAAHIALYEYVKQFSSR